MNARSYRVNLNLSPLDFPAISGLGQSSVFYQSEPHFINHKVVLTVITKYVLIEINSNKEHEILSVQCVYEMPPSEIKSREDIYEFYKDGILTLNEAYQFVKKTQFPTLPSISFPYQPIENYQKEIDRVFILLHSQN